MLVDQHWDQPEIPMSESTKGTHLLTVQFEVTTVMNALF